MNQPKIKGHLRRILFTLALVCASLLLPGAKADRPAGASGSWTDCNVVTDVRQAGPNTVITVIITETFTGTLNGSYVGSERDVVYADGSATFHGSGVFTGTISGQSGTAIMTYAGTASSNGVGTANWVIDQGTGGLAAVHGHGTFQGHETGPTQDCDDTFAGTYSGQIQFAP